MLRRRELYLALSIASLVSLFGIASSTPRSGFKNAAIILLSLLFLVTSLLGVGYIVGRVSGIPSANTRAHHDNEKKIQRKVSLEKVAITIILLLECIVSGMVLYPRLDTNPLAVAEDEVWNPNLFYFTWFSLYASAYLAVVVFVNDKATHCNSSVKLSWFMSIFSSTCTATSLLTISSGPACRGKVLDDAFYCSTALAAGSGSVFCALVLLMCGSCHWQNVRQKLRRLLITIGATILLITQCSMVAVVTRPLGPGHEIGNAFIASWMSFFMSLVLWKNSVASYFMREPEPTSKIYMRGDTSILTDDEERSDEDQDNICDPISGIGSDIPGEVLKGETIYSYNLRGLDPEEDLNPVQVLLDETDAILHKVAELIRRKDPGGIRFNMDPPASHEEIALAPRSFRPDSNIKKSAEVNHKTEVFSRPPTPLPKDTDTYSRRHHIKMNKVITASLSPTVKSRASTLREQSSKGESSCGGVSLMTEISCNKFRRTPTPPLQHTQNLSERSTTRANKKWVSPRTPLVGLSPVNLSSDSDICTVPFNVLLGKDQTSITEISNSRTVSPSGTNADKGTLSVAVSAALHAAAKSISSNKKAHATTKQGKIRSLNHASVTSEIDQYFSSFTHHQLGGSSFSLQSCDILNESIISSMTGDFSQSSTLEHAKKLKTYSDLEESKFNIQGNNRPHTPNSDGILVGILKHSQHSGSRKNTPPQTSSESSRQTSTPRNKSLASYKKNDPDVVLRSLFAEKMKRDHSGGVSESMNGLQFDSRSLP